MALYASERGVAARERKRRLGAVIKSGTGPIGGGVAKLTILRKARGSVVRVRGALIVLQVTRCASGV